MLISANVFFNRTNSSFSSCLFFFSLALNLIPRPRLFIASFMLDHFLANTFEDKIYIEKRLFKNNKIRIFIEFSTRFYQVNNAFRKLNAFLSSLQRVLIEFTTSFFRIYYAFIKLNAFLSSLKRVFITFTTSFFRV